MDGRHEAGQPACATQRAPLDWDQVDWTRVRRTVERFQQKIFRDARAGNYRGVNHYQELLAKSLAARLWAKPPPSALSRRQRFRLRGT